MDAPISQSGLFGEAVSAVVDKFRSAKTQSAALNQFMPRRARDFSTPPSSVSREQPPSRREPPSGGAQATRLPPTTVWGACGRSSSRQQPRKRVNMKRPNKPAASANPGRSWPPGRNEESRFTVTGRGQTAKAFLPTPNALSSLKSVTTTLRGLVCRSNSPSFSLGLAVGGCIRLSPFAARPFAAGEPHVRRHSCFSPAVYGTRAGHPQHFSLHHPEQGGLSFTVEGAAASRPSRHPISGMSSLARHYDSSVTLPSRMGAFTRGIAVDSPHNSNRLHSSVWEKSLPFRRGSPDSSKQRRQGFCSTTGTFLPGVRMGAIHRRHMITTDASMTGWGAVFEGRPASGEWKEEFLFWHINCLELRAVFLALKYFLPVLGEHHVIVRTDNMAVVSHINRQGGSRSRTLDRLARHLLLWSQDKFLSLRAVHVPGVLNLAADFLSRQKLKPGEWMLNRQTVSQIWDLFGKAEVDLFASQESSQCPLWFSLNFPTTLGIDAFAHPWPNVSLYAFPPIKLIPAVLCRVKVSGARLLLIAPFWPSQTWFSELTPLLYRPPWEIPIRRDLLSQLQGKIWHPQPELWKLWVWPIQGQGLWLMVCLPKFRKP